MKFITTVSLKKHLIRREKLFILLIILFWGVILFFFLGQMYYDAMKDTFSHKAEDAFRNALQDKLQDESFEGYLFISKRKLQPKELLDTVYINDAKGRHAYPLDKEKNSRNITYDSRLRYLHSNYLSSYPIAVDSLYEKWNKYLTKERIYGNFVLQILVADNKGNVTISVFPKVPIDGNLMQCFALTVGYRCEVDIRGFYFSSWRQLIGIKGIGYSLLYWLCIIALYGIIIYLRRKMLTIKRERKELMERIRKVKSKPLSIYQLSENIFFHVEQKKTCSG